MLVAGTPCVVDGDVGHFLVTMKIGFKLEG